MCVLVNISCLFSVLFYVHCFPFITLCLCSRTQIKAILSEGIVGNFGTSEAKVRYGVILAKITQKVIANMIFHFGRGLARSYEGVWTLL